jgi:aminopeptidase YwaD
VKPIDIPAAARDCISRTDSLIRSHGPRLAGSTACTAVADELAEEMRPFCDTVTVDEFDVHPGSFYSYMKILPVVYAAAIPVFLFFPRASWAPAACLLAGIALMLLQFAFYRHFPDRLFTRRTGRNVEGIVEPSGPAVRELIISGHHDSAPVARIFSGPFQKLYALAIFIPYVFFIGGIALLVTRALRAGGPPQPWQWIFLLAGLPFVAGYFSMVALGRGTPGAGDNLVASVMAVRLGREIAARRPELLRGTRLRVVSFDAEEAGLRGAAAYMARRVPVLTLPCVHLNFDSLYEPADLHVLTSDINGTVPLSAGMVDELVSCAEARGIRLRKFGMLFGAGGTDAAESARRGLPATTIIGMSTDIVRGGLVYHTPRDTTEHIDPKVIEACMQIAVEYLGRLEAG